MVRTDTVSRLTSVRPPVFEVAPVPISGQWHWFKSLLPMPTSVSKQNRLSSVLRPVAGAAAVEVTMEAEVAVAAVE